MGRRGCAARESHGNRNLLNVYEGCALVVFTCELCELSSTFSFKDQKPPNTSNDSGTLFHTFLDPFHFPKWLLEECYGKKDPFSSEREKDPPSLPLCSKF
ncbi:cysteine-rich DPF motif domain-containing protein 1-like [Carassius auratus]|uniref:Cysteine-rich DPF motif domain-containing protein 1-like n=1 Tax=Carassius auratus TaxID=7957 RepID=A0A6P6LXA0_CARAU|nr:cysteine-rich DPF motif domain-containing protein 1-like [Carassius auratus]